MLQLNLLNHAGVTFNKVNWNDAAEIIRIEKRLRLELKVNESLEPSAVDALIIFLREYATQLSPLLQDGVLYGIATNTPFKITAKTFPGFMAGEEQKIVFAGYFQDNIEACLKQLFNTGKWQDIILLYNKYRFIFNASTLDYFYRLAEGKIDALTHFLKQDADFKNYFSPEFATQVNFYKMLTVINNFTFEKPVLRLVSVVANKYNRAEDKFLMAKIMDAMVGFTATTQANNQLLINNKKAVRQVAGQAKQDDWINNRPQIKTFGAMVFIFIVGYMLTALFYENHLYFFMAIAAELVVLLFRKFVFTKMVGTLKVPAVKTVGWRIRNMAHKLFILQMLPLFGGLLITNPEFILLITFFMGGIYLLSWFKKKQGK